jgi:phage terminase large subunit GpA-like protein
MIEVTAASIRTALSDDIERLRKVMASTEELIARVDDGRRGATIRFSDTLEPVYFEQLASERRVIRYVKGRPVRRFERIAAESLDALVYAYAARQALSSNFDRREN